MFCAGPCAGLVIPFLASRFGWRVVPLALGAASFLLGVVWTAWAANTPATWRGPPAMTNSERQLFGLDATRNDCKSDVKPSTATAEKREDRSHSFLGLPTYFFRVPASYLPILGQTASCVMDYSVMQWAPTRYMAELGCSAAKMGLYVAIPNAVDFIAQFTSVRTEVPNIC
eukprot:SAG31_NODE_1914_length_6931_cov_6.490340_3_plen_171_part_00